MVLGLTFWCHWKTFLLSDLGSSRFGNDGRSRNEGFREDHLVLKDELR